METMLTALLVAMVALPAGAADVPLRPVKITVNHHSLDGYLAIAGGESFDPASSSSRETLRARPSRWFFQNVKQAALPDGTHLAFTTKRPGVIETAKVTKIERSKLPILETLPSFVSAEQGKLLAKKPVAVCQSSGNEKGYWFSYSRDVAQPKLEAVCRGETHGTVTAKVFFVREEQ